MNYVKIKPYISGYIIEFWEVVDPDKITSHEFRGKMTVDTISKSLSKIQNWVHFNRLPREVS